MKLNWSWHWSVIYPFPIYLLIKLTLFLFRKQHKFEENLRLGGIWGQMKATKATFNLVINQLKELVN